ncbi:MAG: L-Ala-D/L-Glu epimerase [Exilispira sp.]
MSEIKNKTNKKTYYYDKVFHITGGTSISSTNIEVEIELENGIKGFGEASPSFRVNGEKPENIMALENYVNDNFTGMKIKEYKKIFEMADKLFATPSLKAAIQFATLDALCETIGIQVYQFFGGSLSEIETDKTIGINSKENRIKELKSFIDEGLNSVKIKVGENLNEDLDFMIEAKEIIKNKKVIVDANMGYSPKEAIHFTRVLYNNGIDMSVFEQPVHMNDIDGLKFVRFNSPYPVAADESAKTKYDVLRLIKEDAIDYINIKLMKSGISDALSIVEMAKAANKRLMIGCMGESSIGINQSVHFAIGLGAFEFYDLDSHLMIKDEKFRGKFVQKGLKMIIF